MEHRFDQLAKDLFRGLSRREALRRLGGTLAGSLFASLGLDRRAWAARPIGLYFACQGDATRLCRVSGGGYICCPTDSLCSNGVSGKH